MLFMGVINVSLWIQSETNCTFYSFANAESILSLLLQKQKIYNSDTWEAISHLIGIWVQ